MDELPALCKLYPIAVSFFAGCFHMSFILTYIFTNQLRTPFYTLLFYRCCLHFIRTVSSMITYFLVLFLNIRTAEVLLLHVCAGCATYFVFSDFVFAVNRALAIIKWNIYRTAFSSNTAHLINTLIAYIAFGRQFYIYWAYNCDYRVNIATLATRHVENADVCYEVTSLLADIVIIPLSITSNSLNLITLILIAKQASFRSSDLINNSQNNISSNNIKMFAYASIQTLMSTTTYFVWIFNAYFPSPSYLFRAFIYSCAFTNRDLIEGILTFVWNRKHIMMRKISFQLGSTDP